MINEEHNFEEESRIPKKRTPFRILWEIKGKKPLQHGLSDR